MAFFCTHCAQKKACSLWLKACGENEGFLIHMLMVAQRYYGRLDANFTNYDETND